MRIVETDNFNGDYPDEVFVNLPRMSKKYAKLVAYAINAACSGENSSRYWKVVDNDYELVPGFEP